MGVTRRYAAKRRAGNPLKNKNQEDLCAAGAADLPCGVAAGDTSSLAR